MQVTSYTVSATVAIAVNAKAPATATQMATELQDQLNRAFMAWAAGKNSSVMVDAPVVTVVPS